MSKRSQLNIFLLSALLFAGSTAESYARQRNYGARSAPRQSAGFTFSVPNFAPDNPSCLEVNETGDCVALQDYEFSDPLLGLFYSRQGLLLFIGRGTQDGGQSGFGDLELLETIIDFNGALKPFPGTEESDIQFVIPVGLHSDYRRLASDVSGGTIDRFESTVLALGAGVGVVKVNGVARFAAQIVPYFGLASSSFGLGNGTSSLLNADIEITAGPVAGAIGLSLGYSFRWQKWNLEEQFVTDEDFTGRQHALRLGVFW